MVGVEEVNLRHRLGLLCLSGIVASVGCVQNGSRPSLWPTLGGGAGSGAGVSSGIASTAKGVKGQFSSMGTAVSSAYNKTKSTITSAFTTTPPKTDDPTSLNSKAPSIGPEIYVAQGQLYESTGQFPKAMDNYSKALEIEPKNVAALASLARLHDRQNDSAKAVEFFKKALEMNPSDDAMHVELGNVYRKQGQLAAAKESYQKAVNLKPKEASHRSALAGVFLDEGREKEALNELANVESPAMANYRLAYLYFSRQNVPQAQTYLGNALRIDPNLQPARDMMAQLNGGTQIAQQAMNVYQSANGLYQNASTVIQGTNPAAGATSMPGPSMPMTSGAQVPATAGGPASNSVFR